MVTTSFSLVIIEYFLLVLIRVATFVFVAPFFSLPNVPNRVKIGTACFMSFIVIYMVKPESVYSYETVIGYAAIVLQEAATGLLIGFGASICNHILLFAGNIIDMDIGISMAQEFNPAMNAQSTITGEMYFYGVNLLLLASGMYRYLIRALIESFTLIPIGGAVFETDYLLQGMTDYMTESFVIAFRIMLPVFATMLIMNCILGIMAKVAPQMNMFSVGIQLKILAGFAVLFLTIFLLPDIADFIFEEMKTMIVTFVKGMYQEG